MKLFFSQYERPPTEKVATHGLREVRDVDGDIDSVELFLAAPCVQSCCFCVYSRERGTDLDITPLCETVSWVKSMSDVLREREKPGEIVLSGPDCLRHPDIENILNLFADERRVALAF